MLQDAHSCWPFNRDPASDQGSLPRVVSTSSGKRTLTKYISLYSWSSKLLRAHVAGSGLVPIQTSRAALWPASRPRFRLRVPGPRDGPGAGAGAGAGPGQELGRPCLLSVGTGVIPARANMFIGFGLKQMRGTEGSVIIKNQPCWPQPSVRRLRWGGHGAPPGCRAVPGRLWSHELIKRINRLETRSL